MKVTFSYPSLYSTQDEIAFDFYLGHIRETAERKGQRMIITTADTLNQDMQ